MSKWTAYSTELFTTQTKQVIESIHGRSMADSFERAVFTGEQVLGLLDEDGEDGGLDDMFFPGSDEEFGMQEEEIGRHDTQKQNK